MKDEHIAACTQSQVAGSAVETDTLQTLTTKRGQSHHLTRRSTPCRERETNSLFPPPWRLAHQAPEGRRPPVAIARGCLQTLRPAVEEKRRAGRMLATGQAPSGQLQTRSSGGGRESSLLGAKLCKVCRLPHLPAVSLAERVVQLQASVASCCGYDRFRTAQTNCRGRAEGHRVPGNRRSKEMLDLHL